MLLERLATNINDAFLIQAHAFSDERGYFKETYVRSKYRELGIADEFVQDNVSLSGRRVLRGLHADPQMTKLVQVLLGRVFDVIVDARRGSPTFGAWQGFELSAEDHRQLYIPAGCLHGFFVLSDSAVFSYKQTAEYAPEREIGVRWDDPDLSIAWPLSGPPRVSPKDMQNRRFRDVFPQGS
jgi:dTDP-4-dehydrorhamnose 3,5-epimerase